MTTRTHSRRLGNTAILLGVACLPLMAGTARAAGGSASARPPAPPPPPPLDSGWVYHYGIDNSVRTIYRSSPDGSIQGAVAGAPAEYSLGPSVGTPSKLRHNGSRWYLALSGDNFDIVFPGLAGANPGGPGVAEEIDAVREGDTVGLRLTDNRAACIAVFPGGASTARPMWTTNAAGVRDAALSWVGTQWADVDSNPDDCESFVGAGIFRADLLYDGSGAVTGIGPAVLAVPLGVRSDMTPDLSDFGWSPNAASVAYTRRPDSGGGALMVAAAGSPVSSHTQVVAGRYYDVEWSPDQDAATAGLQTTIAYTGWNAAMKVKGGVWGIQPNGSGVKLLAEAKQGSTSYVHYSPMWSPAGSHLAYVEAGSGGGLPSPGIRQVRRMAKDGSGNVVLVSPGPEYSSVLYGLNWTDVD
jgi:hypothetical protein